VFELFLAGTQSGDFYFIPVDKNKPPRRFEYHEKGIFDILIVDGIALTAGGDGKLGVWDIEHERLTESILVSNSKLRSLSKSNHQSVFAVSASDQNIYLLDAVQFSLQHTITAAHIPSVFSTQFSPDGKYLVSGGRDALVKVWDIKEGYDLQKQLSAHWFTINDLCFDQSGKLLFTGSRDKTVRIWDTGTWALLKEINLQKYDSHQNSINCILWLENRRHLITAGDDRKIMIWAVEEY
jgi:WD40 repeat protein